MKTIRTKALIDNLEEVIAFADRYLEENECPFKVQMQLDVVIDELFSNISKFAYGEEEIGEIIFKIDVNDNIATLTFEDYGFPFNPLEHVDPDITISAEKRDIGGLGILMVRKMTDEASYEYRDGKNIMCLKKKLY